MEKENIVHRDKISSFSADRIKQKVRILVLISTLSVALVFGLSFYFALLSNSTAVAKKVPELMYVADKMKSLLIINTIIFTAIIVASFYYLSHLLTLKVFRELDSVQDALFSISQKKLPDQNIIKDNGTFSELKLALKNAIYSIREKELKELEFLRKLSKRPLEENSENIDKELKEIISEKRKLLALSTDEKTNITEVEEQTVQ